MNELLNEILKQIKGAWRYRWWGLAAAWGVCILGWPVVSLQQPVYEASARVFVDTKSMLRTLLDEQIVDSTLDEQLGFVREAILGTNQLVSIARELNMLEANASNAEIQAVVGALKESVRVTSLNDAMPRGVRLMRAPSEDTYTIAYRNNDRGVAVDVVWMLLAAFERNAISGKRASSEQAGEFLRDQISIYEQRLRNAEEKLAAFNRENYDRLPNLQGGYFRELQTQTQGLEASRKDVSLVQSRLNSIEKQLRGETWVADTVEVDPTSTEGRLRAANTRLDELLLRFTEDHPDVQAVRESIDVLKERRAEEVGMLASGDAAVLSDNPVYQALQISKNEASAELATLHADIKVREVRLRQLRGLIDEMPEVEAQLSQLNRDYDVIQSHYQSLLNNLERERLSSEVVANDEIDFRVIDPPSALGSPVSIPPIILHFAVLALALGSAAALMVLMANLKPVVSSATDIARAIDAPILGTVSRISMSVGKGSEHYLRFYVLSGCLCIAFLLVVYTEIAGVGLRSVL